jgi:thiosulfate/3-mercaptopyruvate sulfurtransferase
MRDILVSPQWLEARLGEVQVVDTAWYMPADPRNGRQEHEEGHIPGAIFFDIDAVADHSTDLPHMLPTPEAFARTAGELGLRRDRTVVCYDQDLFSAPRVWWTLRTMGFPDVRVLDGGLKRWRAEGRPLATTQDSLPATTLEPMFDERLVRDLDAVRQTLQERSSQVVDARPAGRFLGDTPEPRTGLRSGHMPGARNVPFASLLDADGRLKSEGELRTAFRDAGVDVGGPIVTTCGSGVSAAVLALALATLGREDVAVYDGSWTEWGGRTDTEVVTGA